MDVWYDRQHKLEEDIHKVMLEIKQHPLTCFTMGDFMRVQEIANSRRADHGDLKNAQEILRRLKLAS